MEHMTMTKRRVALSLSLSAVLLGGGCAKGGGSKKDVEELRAENEKLNQRLKKLEDFLNPIMAAQQRQRQQQQAPPDSSTVYAVPIEGSPFKGAEHAKVTIVEGYEFA